MAVLPVYTGACPTAKAVSVAASGKQGGLVDWPHREANQIFLVSLFCLACEVFFKNSSQYFKTRPFCLKCQR